MSFINQLTAYGWIAAGTGLILALTSMVCLLYIIRLVRLLANGVRVEGTVVRQIADTRYFGDEDASADMSQDIDVFAAVFEYQSPNGQTEEYATKLFSSKPFYHTGERYPLIVSNTESRKVKVATFWGLYRDIIIQLVMITLPVLFLVLMLTGEFSLFRAR